MRPFPSTPGCVAGRLGEPWTAPPHRSSIAALILAIVVLVIELGTGFATVFFPIGRPARDRHPVHGHGRRRARLHAGAHDDQSLRARGVDRSSPGLRHARDRLPDPARRHRRDLRGDHAGPADDRPDRVVLRSDHLPRGLGRLSRGCGGDHPGHAPGAQARHGRLPGARPPAVPDADRASSPWSSLRWCSTS